MPPVQSSLHPPRMRLLLLTAVLGSMLMAMALSQDSQSSLDLVAPPSLPEQEQQLPLPQQIARGTASVAEATDTRLVQKEGLPDSQRHESIGATEGQQQEKIREDKQPQQQRTEQNDQLLQHAFNPFVRLEEQVDLPQVSGVAPPSAAHLNAQGHAKSHKQLRQEYLARLEQERVDRAGSLYLELDDGDVPLSSPQSPLGSHDHVRISREVLPWEVEGFEDEDDESVIGADAFGDQEDEFYNSFLRIKVGKDTKVAVNAKTQVTAASGGDEGTTVAVSVQNPISPLEDAAIKDTFHDKEQMVQETEKQQLQPISPSSELRTSTSGIDVGTEDSQDSGKSTEDPNVQSGAEEIVSDPTSPRDSPREGEHRTHYEHRRSLPFLPPRVERVRRRSTTAGREPQRGHKLFELTDEEAKDFAKERPLNLHKHKAPRQQQRDEIDLMVEEAQLEWMQSHRKGPSGAERLEMDDVNEQDKVFETDDDLDGTFPMDGEPTTDPSHGSSHRGPKSTMKMEDQDIDEDGTMIPDKNSREPYSKIVRPLNPNESNSSLIYLAYNRHGDRIIDFSMVGWNEGNTPLPDLDQIPVLERLTPRPGAELDNDQGDDSDRIQLAINRTIARVAGSVNVNTVTPLGAVVLEKGIYRISHPITIEGSGILFRGDPRGGTRIVCRWAPNDYRYAIKVESPEDDEELEESQVPVIAEYTPVGSFSLQLDPEYLDGLDYKVGDAVMVTRVGNTKWIHDIGMDDFDTDKENVKPWKKMKANMYRTIRALDRTTGIVQFDAPLPIAISRQYGGGWMTKIGVDNKLRAVGLQFFDMVFPANIGRTTDDMLDDEGRGSTDYRFAHEIFSNYVIRFDNIQHAYMTHVTSAFFHNFASTGSQAHHLTFDANVHSYPDEMLSGQSTFQLSSQLTLIRNTLSQSSFHFFVDISHVPGPNVVHRAQATNVGRPNQPMNLDFAPGEVGPHMKFCTGMLFDQVTTDGPILIVDRGSMGSGQGLSGANSVVWNSRARKGVLTHRAKGFQNFVIGSEAKVAHDRKPWESHGWKEHVGAEVLPGSLYLRQLSDRLDRLKKGWVA